MFKGRIWPIIAVAIGLILIFLVCRASPLLKQGKQSTALPVDVSSSLSRTVLPGTPESRASI